MLNYAIIDKISNIWKTISTTICTIYIKNEKTIMGQDTKKYQKGLCLKKMTKRKEMQLIIMLESKIKRFNPILFTWLVLR